jgi:hypothetical protein
LDPAQQPLRWLEEHGYVSYWEKLGAADLGDGLTIPVNINFNSHRESSSPTLGKGWLVALLESHVEPLDENHVKVVMPDGWNFYFYRKDNTETWVGNAGWVGETNSTLFTITAPCGWKIKFDAGKIQEIDTPKNRTLTYKYNGPVATEVDIDGKPFLQVETNTATEVAENLLLNGQKIDVALAPRPRIQTASAQNLVTGFDLSLNHLQWPDGKRETFTFATTDKTLDPTLAITHPDQTQRHLTWDPTTRQIKSDGDWTYHLTPGSHVVLSRTDLTKGTESYHDDPTLGTTTVQNIYGVIEITSRFTSGPLAGRVRRTDRKIGNKIECVYSASYDESGRLVRETENGLTVEYFYNAAGLPTKAIQGNHILWNRSYDAKGNLMTVNDLAFDTLTQ